MEAKAMSKEIMDAKAQTGTAPLWTNSMFGGMPAFQIWARYPGNITTYVIDFLKTVFPDPVDTILCFFSGILLLAECIENEALAGSGGGQSPLLSALIISFTF